MRFRHHHTCDGCGRTGTWDVRWRSYGSVKQMEGGDHVPRLCSPACVDLARRKGTALPWPTRREQDEWERAAKLSELAARIAHIVEQDRHTEQADVAAELHALDGETTWQSSRFQAAAQAASRAGFIRIVRRRSGPVEFHAPKHDVVT